MPPTRLTTAPMQAEAHELSTQDLWLAFRATGSREDRDRLVLHYVGLVTFVASRVRTPMSANVDQADLIQSGVIGLMEAVDRFEHERGLKFETYAVTRIRGAILDSLRAQDWVPRSVRKRARDLDTASQSVAARLGHSPSAADLADELGVTSVEVGVMCSLTSRMRVLELDAIPSCVAEGQGLSFADVLADPLAELPGDALDAQADRDDLRAALRGLDERSRTVLMHSYVDGLTLAQIGRLLGVTESRVSQLRAKALRELARRLAALRDA